MAGPRYTRLGAGGYPIAAGGSVSVPIIQVLGEQVRLSEVVGTARALVRLRNESSQVIEFFAIWALVINRMINETVRVVESTLPLRFISYMVNEALRISETLVETRAISLVRNETVRLTEAMLTSTALTQMANEVVHIGETLVRTNLLTRMVNEVVNIVEVLD
jgi:hypothetical protein